jgi:hypothetical protein
MRGDCHFCQKIFALTFLLVDIRFKRHGLQRKSLQPIDLNFILCTGPPNHTAMRSKREFSRFQVLITEQARLFRCSIAGPTVQELDGLCHDLGEVAGLALFLVLVRLDSSFDVDQASLVQVFLADLPEPVPGFHIDPLGGLLRFTVFRFPAVADGYAKVSYLLASRCEFAFGILAQASYQLDFI